MKEVIHSIGGKKMVISKEEFFSVMKKMKLIPKKREAFE
jgi:hypothetical protein